MTDRELLELAADAFGLSDYWTYSDRIGLREQAVHGVPHCGHVGPYWNPLTDSGDAFRLMIKLKFSVETPCIDTATVFMNKFQGGVRMAEVVHSEPAVAVRRAIVLAAAEIGKSK